MLSSTRRMSGGAAALMTFLPSMVLQTFLLFSLSTQI